MKGSNIILLLSTLVSSDGLDKSITTGFRGTNLANGNIVIIKAKTQPVSIKGFDINMSGPPAPNPAPVEIHVLPGVDPGKKSSSHVYQKIFAGSILGAGKNNVTSLPELTNPVVIPAGASYSFYITVANYSLYTYMHFDKNLGGQGSVMASDDNLEVIQGYALAYPFFAYNGDWRWNGNVYYSVEEPNPTSTSNPSMMPTPNPTSSQPSTSQPTTSKPTSLGQTLSPTTKKPTMQPTKQPTSQPTLVGQTPKPSIQPASQSPSLPASRPTGQPWEWEESTSPSPSGTLSPTVSKLTRMPTKRPTSSSAKLQLCIYPALLIAAVLKLSF